MRWSCNYPPDLGRGGKLIISFWPLSSERPCDVIGNLLGVFLGVYFFKKKNTPIIGSLSLYSLLALNRDLICEHMAAASGHNVARMSIRATMAKWKHRKCLGRLPWRLSDKEPTFQSRRQGSILIWEDSTCLRASKPVCHSYWACALGPRSTNYWAHTP